MSVRRLAPPELQPASFAFTPENLAWAKQQIAKYPEGRQASAVIPILWRAQEQAGGWTSRKAIEYVADLLGMAQIRVLEIATFYTMFLLSPVGRKAHVQWCGTTPCLLRGGEDIRRVCEQRIHHEPFHVSADGDFSWEEVECLGACVNAPMVLIGKDTYEDLSPESFEKVLDAIARGETPTPGPQNGRHFSAPMGGDTTLRDVPSREVAAADAAAANVAAIEVAPVDEVLADAAPVDKAPASEAPVEVARAEVAPSEAAVEKAPADVAPIDVAPAEEAPADKAPTSEAPVEAVRAEEAPGEAAVEKAPADVAPLDVAPAEEAPPDKAPISEALGDVAHTDEAPGEAAVEKAPVDVTAADVVPTSVVPISVVPTSEAPAVPADVGPADVVAVDEAPVAPADVTPVDTAPADKAPVEAASNLAPAPAGADALAAAEEADIKAKLAALPQDASAEDKANAVGTRPQGLAAPRNETADNLRRIKGIGPVNESKLHALGIFHFDQIAAWGRPEIRWVGTYLAFPGRIDRERWVAQATILAAGGDVRKPQS